MFPFKRVKQMTKYFEYQLYMGMRRPLNAYLTFFGRPWAYAELTLS